MVNLSLDHGLLIVGPWLRYRWTMVQRLDIISQNDTSSLYLDYFPFVLGINAVIVNVIYTILIRKWLVLNAHSLFLYSIVYQHHNGFKTFKEAQIESKEKEQLVKFNTIKFKNTCFPCKGKQNAAKKYFPLISLINQSQ